MTQIFGVDDPSEKTEINGPCVLEFAPSGSSWTLSVLGMLITSCKAMSISPGQIYYQRQISVTETSSQKLQWQDEMNKNSLGGKWNWEAAKWEIWTISDNQFCRLHDLGQHFSFWRIWKFFRRIRIYKEIFISINIVPKWREQVPVGTFKSYVVCLTDTIDPGLNKTFLMRKFCIRDLPCICHNTARTLHKHVIA